MQEGPLPMWSDSSFVGDALKTDFTKEHLDTPLVFCKCCI